MCQGRERPSGARLAVNQRLERTTPVHLPMFLLLLCALRRYHRSVIGCGHYRSIIGGLPGIDHPVLDRLVEGIASDVSRPGGGWNFGRT